ncbi:hypothetical protein MYMA111404_02330 [Mycoplasma marinum]|uniref:MFS transporter n=1 Tax=Mycoplasma marinum TaxID=1937190 RepID=A0A4R0XK58_9MOLU|nr:hypothetical protein [Mycoplasma marinum]TCG11023.1 hypothetical protein C4B24_03295 [Mycoplasma marinum]
MNTLIISSATFGLIILIITFLLIKTKDIAKYNIFIYVSLFIFWFVMQIFKTNLSNIKNTSEINRILVDKPWVWPIIISLYQMTQVIVRIPIGVICSKFKSRKLGIQLVAVVFIVTATTTIISNFAFWSVIATVIAAGFVGATFGLNSQYWSENWNISKVFKSSVIMYTIPLATAALGNIFKYSLTNGVIDMGSLRWIILASLIFGSFYLILYTLTKERKETIGLDLGAPAEIAKTSKGYSMIWKLSFSACSMAFLNNLLINENVIQQMGISGTSESNLFSLVSIVTLLVAIFTGVYLVKNFDIVLIKYLSFVTVVIGIVIDLFLVILKVNLPLVWALTSLLIVFGSITFQITLFGVTLHLDHKHPALVLGIFLTTRSFSYGAGQLLSDEIIINSPMSTNNVLLSILCISIFITIIATLFFIVNHKKMDRLYKTLQEYEFGFK